MLDFSFTEDQEMFRSMVRDFGQKEIAPVMKARAETDPFALELRKKMGDLGFWGLGVPEEYGGSYTPGASWVNRGIATEELAKVHFTAGFHLFQYSSISSVLVRMASDKIKEEWLPPILSGEKLIAMSVTEAAGGSDVRAVQTTATRDGDYYIINGEKNSTCWGTQAEAAFVLTKTAPKEYTFILVPLDLQGISKAEVGDMGYGPIGRSIVSFEDVRVPVDNRLGEEGEGFSGFMEELGGSRVIMCLVGLGPAIASVEETITYAKERMAFGNPIAKYQAISFKIAEMASLCDIARWSCYRVLWMRDQGRNTFKEASMIKWWIMENAVSIIHKCLCIHGHYGYSKDMPFEQRMRDVIGGEIDDGSREMQLRIVATALLGKEYR